MFERYCKSRETWPGGVPNNIVWRTYLSASYETSASACSDLLESNDLFSWLPESRALAKRPHSFTKEGVKMTSGAEYVTIDPGRQQTIQNRKSLLVWWEKKLSYPILGVVVKKKPALLGPYTSGVWLCQNGIVHCMALWIICLSWRVPPQATLSCPISVWVFGNFTVLLSKLLHVSGTYHQQWVLLLWSLFSWSVCCKMGASIRLYITLSIAV